MPYAEEPPGGCYFLIYLVKLSLKCSRTKIENVIPTLILKYVFLVHQVDYRSLNTMYASQFYYKVERFDPSHELLELHPHYRGGNWKTGGSCHLETLPELSSTQRFSRPWFSMLMAARDIISFGTPVSTIEILNVTQMTALRKDGHSSLYYLGPTAGPSSLHKQDCSHWCLPGVPDAWNELLHALFIKWEWSRHQNNTGPSLVQL